MKNPSHRLSPYRSLLAGFVITLVGARGAAADPQIVAADSLTAADHPGMEGKSLDGLAAPKGGASWIVPSAHAPYTGAPWNFGPSTILAKTGDSVVGDPGQKGPICGNIPIDSPDTTVTVQAQIKVATADWIGVGFQSAPQAIVFTPGSLMFVSISKAGTWTLFSDQGSLKAIGSGPVKDFNPATFTTLALQYNPNTTKATVTINGKDIAGPLDTPFPPTTDVKSAGFYVYGAQDSAQIKNFQVSVAP
jgi:hypothetical protein